ncbi:MULTISPECIES: MurR/RpiR family transcriptional regulator [unclassified Paenibacillus]|uniref:MurR/RpiR family transcriptional regulator n=1 Tax=unclassified Paenibacillus TaxID=185978 RepID=UPI001AE74161|nr:MULTISPECIES: MurR/RpiR family transcriptional regulator [unclassified Paenibacillus]MBP1154551.1 DNA-binding MurR/RpiR family transcriptional regulator [Paenibacillus sp. PvP091]MBP1170065.1 DNA-binding MurR/RpiR family transcriptional regulator [Paenibacillus sp. PvR098]MBP2441093.1 DNA-binding MurR/RpiR family transcriptional regulator [Paenibacillus sp. PvP052]
MASILQTIRERLPTMHRKEQILAQYVLEHAEEAVHLSITELAERAGASTATVSRFCRSLIFKGYSDFRMKLGSELAQHPAQSTYQDIVEGNSLYSIVQAIEANHLRSISDTTRQLDISEIQRAVSALHAARRIDLYGMATSGVVALDFQQKLVRIGKMAQAWSDSHMQITSASTLEKGDVALGFSYSGETLETLGALLCAKDRGAITISLTKFGSNSISQVCDIRLFASSLEEGMRRGDMASRIAQLHVLDILFTALVSGHFDDYVPLLEQSFLKVKKYRKEKGR